MAQALVLAEPALVPALVGGHSVLFGDQASARVPTRQAEARATRTVHFRLSPPTIEPRSDLIYGGPQQSCITARLKHLPDPEADHNIKSETEYYYEQFGKSD